MPSVEMLVNSENQDLVKDLTCESNERRRSNELKVDTYVAPWVLPTEEIPAYIKWYEHLVFEKIIVTIPDDMEFIEFLNVDKVEIIGNVAEIKEIMTTVSLPHYFGFVVRSRKIFESLRVAKFIRIEFKLRDQTTISKEICCRIFRPKLELVNYPRTVEIRDGQESVLPLHLKFVGFGDILVNAEASIGGAIVSHGDSIIYELVRRMCLSTLSEEEKEKLKKKRTGLRIAPNYIKKMADEIEKKVDQGKLPFEGLTEKEVDEIKEWWGAIRDRTEWLDALSTFEDRIGNILLDILSDILERNPTSNVRLSDPRTKIVTRISAPAETLKLTLKYKDVLENSYLPLEFSVKLVDKRTVDRETLVSIPIKIERWDDKAFRDVEKLICVGEL